MKAAHPLLVLAIISSVSCVVLLLVGVVPKVTLGLAIGYTVAAFITREE